MPRITKQQKEAGVTKPKPKSKPVGGPSLERGAERGGSSRGRGGGAGRGIGRGGKVGSHPSRPGTKGGFRVGPAHASRDAYLGKAKKIKADLIQRAKMKKSYAKVLKSEGMESGRLGEGSKRRGERGAPTQVQEGEDEEARRRRRAGPAPGDKQQIDMSDSEEEEEEEEAGYAGLASYTNTAGAEGAKRRSGSGNGGSGGRGSRREEGKKVRVRALSLSPRPMTETTTTKGEQPKSSFRDIKREAFSKFHQPRAREGAVGIRPGAGDARGGRGGRGQPNMGARMGALLEKIKRDR